MRLAGVSIVGALALAYSVVGCLSTNVDAHDERGELGESSDPIVGGTKASSYAEAVLIDMSVNGRQVSACSGSVIAPKVVLTAGHCIEGMTGWRVRAPYANNQTVSSTSAITYDWGGNNSASVNPNQHDIGLIFLPTAITLTSYPSIGKSKLADGSSVVNIGRIQSGSFSSTNLFVGSPVTVRDATRSGYKYDYISAEIIESGDSGGPVEIPGTHTIVAVNSGAGGGTQVLARTDLLATWIDGQIASHGGGGTTNPPDPPPVKPDAGVPSGNCTQEKEPNDAYTSPGALAGTVCGSLSGDNQDWFTWSIGGATAYTVALTASGDAELRMWKLVSGRYREVNGSSAQLISNTASAAGSYVVAVYSPSSAAQTYRVSLTK